ncbi:peptide chain release factor N(5)-glutamine methyltransferase [Salinispira pacifica]|uniref:Release factor glutamine methyltransferase n=1 Tax=Salinispira pacifica TaxID=1307761 RepID=V5WIC9_9SPIO|nr:peptide chain release factor N(5)-glutamine methyltransferase [Salinispira pacifica]AHC15572.1 Protein-N(5)-glutamine methyltransferase [Salinispira pacifica]
MNPRQFQGLSLSRAVQLGRSLLPAGPYDSPGLDALILLCHSMNISKEQYYARMQDSLPQAAGELYARALERRISGEPVAYILGFKEFYGLEFRVNPGVLIPRPDTEILVDWVLESHPADSPLVIHDCCSGSGAIAIALAHMRPAWDVSASDISLAAGEVFGVNAAALVPTSPPLWFQSDLLESAAQREMKFHIITANPPYLTPAETRERELEGWKEPMLALDGGEKGLDLIQRLASQAHDLLEPGGWLYIEAADDQADAIEKLLKTLGYADLECKKDLAGMKRISRGRKR